MHRDAPTAQPSPPAGPAPAAGPDPKRARQTDSQASSGLHSAGSVERLGRAAAAAGTVTPVSDPHLALRAGSASPAASRNSGEPEVDQEQLRQLGGVVQWWFSATIQLMEQHHTLLLLLADPPRGEPEGWASCPSDFHKALLEEYSETAFRQTLRMSRARYHELWRCITDTQAYVPPGGSPIDPRLWLSAVLYQLGHGLTSRDTANTFGIAASSFSEHRTMILDSLCEALSAHPDARMGWPTDSEGWAALANTFVPNIFSRFAAFRGVVAAGDGTLIPVDITDLAPNNREVWRCRKGFLAQNAMVFFDGTQRIITAKIMDEGSASDATLLNQQLQLMKQCNPPEGAFILFDAGG